MSLAALVRHLCLSAGLDEALIDVTGLWGAVEGYVIGALESPRASISTLARHFGFDAIESEGVIRFVMRGRASTATLAIDDLVSSREGEALELTRGQETELAQALKTRPSSKPAASPSTRRGSPRRASRWRSRPRRPNAVAAAR